MSGIDEGVVSRTSATAVQRARHRASARASSVRPRAARWRRSQRWPTWAWDSPARVVDESEAGPRECLEVTTRVEGDRGAMKMMQPLDLTVRAYGGAVWASMADHWGVR